MMCDIFIVLSFIIISIAWAVAESKLDKIDRGARKMVNRKKENRKNFNIDVR